MTKRSRDQKNKTKRILGISVGDINGVGPEVIIKTFSDSRLLNYCIPVIFGCKSMINYYTKALNINGFTYHIARDMRSLNYHKINLFCNFEDQVDTTIEMGKSSQNGGKYAYLSLKTAVQALKNNEIDALVTAPINKYNIQNEEFNYPGHTEYLQAQFGSDDLMIMVSDVLKVAVQTGHMPLKDVPMALTGEGIVNTLKIYQESLTKDFGIRNPKIAVLALNPHSGDEGLLGSEEKEIIEPAIEEANKKGILAMGPFPADGFFGNQMYAKFDGVLAMYHDQGLAPFKSVTFETGVNFTAGLPIIRTSPSHGTGFGIAGKNIANPASFREAVYLALRVLANRDMYAELTANPLKTKVVREKED